MKSLFKGTRLGLMGLLFYLTTEATMAGTPRASIAQNHELSQFLADKSITLLDVYGEALFRPVDVELDMRLEDEDLLEQLIKDIHFTAGAMRGEMEEPTVPLGRFKGKGLFDAMEQSGVLDLQLFFSYIQARPAKYEGKEWKVSEIYATWQDGGVPLPLERSAERFVISEEAEQEIILQYMGSESLKDFLSAVCDLADDLGRNGKMGDAIPIYDRALDIAQTWENPEAEGWVWFSRGDTEDDLERYVEAELSFRKAKAAFESGELFLEAAITCTNIGSALVNSGSPEKARDILEEGLESLEDWAKNNDIEDSETLHPVIGLIHRNIGNAWLMEEKYKKALKSYETGLEYLEGHESEMAQTRLAGLYEQMAHCLDKLGRDKEEAEIRSKLEAL